MKKRKLISCVLTACLFFSVGHTQSRTITVKAGQPGVSIEPTLWGVFFEDINMGADGGIYAELVKNRSFEFAKPLIGWKRLGEGVTEGDLLVLNRGREHTANPRFLRVTLHGNGKKDAGGKPDTADKANWVGIQNEGFRGMGIKKGGQYDFSLMARLSSGHVTLHIELVNGKGEILGGDSLVLASVENNWKKQGVRFMSSATELKAMMNVWFEGDGVADVDMLSLFPEDTWKKRPGGMRADMIQLLADMKPGFIRFPGGCIVEGPDLATRYQWKKTIGPLEERPLVVNRWNFEFAHRPAPDYYQTFGLGFFEYFQLAEDIGAEPLPILNCGMACQFNTAELVPMEALDPYVQDALDLVEFANGGTDTKWGKVRSDMGHPEPFHLKMMGIGNENWGPQYIERLKVFTKALKTKYPAIKLINSAGTDPDGERFDHLNRELRAMQADIIDEHYYRRPEWFFRNARRYDNYPRNGSKIFGGEYAAQSDKTVSVNNKNCWLTALSEAAFMTGLERNADVVSMASYAPLFAHTDAWQWTPDLIWVNNLESFGTPDYYVQKLFSLNKGTRVVPIIQNKEVIAGQDSLYAAASLDEKTNELIIKLVNASGKEQNYPVVLEGARKLASEGFLTILKSDELYNVNSFAEPRRIAPEESVIPVKGKKIDLRLAPWSLNVLRIKYK
ncbi:alpha-L-arabinofuranosidase C-terminal domain-containing protein [Flavitalea flava]